MFELKPLMVFSGESGLGKSYAAFLVHYLYVLLLSDRLNHFFVEKRIDFAQLLKKCVSNDVIFRLSAKELFDWVNKDAVAYIGYLVGNGNMNGEVDIKIPYPNDSFNFIYQDETVGLDNQEEVYYKIQLDNFTYKVKAANYESDASPFVNLICAVLKKLIFDDYQLIQRTFLMPPSRGALMELSERPAFRSGMYHEFFEFKAALNRPLQKPVEIDKELAECLCNVNMGNLKQEDGRIIYSTSEGVDMPLTAAASSVKEMAPFTLFLNKFSAGDSSVFLEEPEAHLHPQRQMRVADLIACAVGQGCHMQITTHSDYFIKRLNNLIKLYVLKDKMHDSDEWRAIMKQGNIKESYLINPSNVGAYLLMRNNDGSSCILEQDILAENEIPFESFYPVIEEDIRLSRQINKLF